MLHGNLHGIPIGNPAGNPMGNPMGIPTGNPWELYWEYDKESYGEYARNIMETLSEYINLVGRSRGLRGGSGGVCFLFLLLLFVFYVSRCLLLFVII